ncbi:hypothetical protein HNP37_003979 [Flavobacterium nitrogenifigens]|uniref:Uncharacterized protein n=2 Tax=Flavobacterium TaxID=237 RepID=A0A7W7N9W5_9FLAO|nr:hypothetical protein [Flavobacterium nitrogenifigens]MBB6388949.1 hypothetical protein [Flavobacterium notoginsengisoli]
MKVSLVESSYFKEMLRITDNKALKGFFWFKKTEICYFGLIDNYGS